MENINKTLNDLLSRTKKVANDLREKVAVYIERFKNRLDKSVPALATAISSINDYLIMRSSGIGGAYRGLGVVDIVKGFDDRNNSLIALGISQFIVGYGIEARDRFMMRLPVVGPIYQSISLYGNIMSLIHWERTMKFAIMQRNEVLCALGQDELENATAIPYADVRTDEFEDSLPIHISAKSLKTFQTQLSDALAA